MIVRILEQQDAIRAVLAQDCKTSHLVPSWQDIDVLQSVVAAIKPFQKITDMPSGEKRVTCSAIKPMIQLIQETMVNHQDDDTALRLRNSLQCVGGTNYKTCFKLSRDK